ncbi:hypothetical protein [Alkalimonas amylolytica]|uniref:Uncharacterized protein n=1 Tax=Alkalimonas amylolytica TaxID=152573 RepID=A0A1H4E0G6_ALKAM|nr:hypothetical protein [Alkalimonas amylolytica]SEA78544.1 hypothetical protein SAMN04488051_106144 [Alkalimonas amylolytica]
MKLYPYQNLKAGNLGLLLFVARVLGIFSMALLTIAVCIVLFGIWWFFVPDIVLTDPDPTALYKESRFQLSALTSTSFIAAVFAGFSFVLAFISGVSAAIVSWEASLLNRGKKIAVNE